MILYRYGPYKADEDPDQIVTDLMKVISDLVLRSNLELDEALSKLIDRGYTGGIVIEESAMGELLEKFRRQLMESHNSFLEKYHLREALHDADHAIEESAAAILKSDERFNPELSYLSFNEEIATARDQLSIDRLMELKWRLPSGPLGRKLRQMIDRLARRFDEREQIEEAVRNYNFVGPQAVDRHNALRIVQHLKAVEKVLESLNFASGGNLLQFSMEELARFLGPESLREYIELRDEIRRKLTNILRDRGEVVDSDSEEVGVRLSPAAIRRIGRRAVSEIFSTLRADSSSAGGYHWIESGESETLTDRLRPYDYGDTISQLDLTGAVLTAFSRRGSTRPHMEDLESFVTRGSARSATAVLLDMSGSMYREERFFNGKKMVLALDALIREEYPDDRLFLLGFGSEAEEISPGRLATLQPWPVTMFEPFIELNYSVEERSARSDVPKYFTNLQHGLQMARRFLSATEVENRQILLVTDGVPTAHFSDGNLCINYPPVPENFEAALREVAICSAQNITINTFLLTTEWEQEYFGDESFIRRFARTARGRIFYPRAGELSQFVLLDFINGRKSLIQ